MTPNLTQGIGHQKQHSYVYCSTGTMSSVHFRLRRAIYFKLAQKREKPAQRNLENWRKENQSVRRFKAKCGS